MVYHTLEELFRNQKNEDSIAIVIPDGGPSITYNELVKDVQKLTDQIVHQGISVGDTVSIVLQNGWPFIASFLAVTWSRGIASPLNAQYKVDEFLFYLEDTHAKAVILSHTFPKDHPAREAAAKLGIQVWEVVDGDLSAKEVTLITPKVEGEKKIAHESPRPEDVAIFLHTSGTTSKPKGVPLTHLNLATSISNITHSYKLTNKDTSLIVMPLFHVHGLIGATLSTLATGGKLVIPPRFSASTFWKHTKEYNVTWYSAVPTIHQVLLLREEQEEKEGRAVGGDRGLRFIRSCSSSLAPSILETLEKKFGCPVLEAYGMTEASHQMSSNPLPEEGPRKPGTVGKGTNVRIAILDENGISQPTGSLGEVCIKGENVTKGYHNNPEANKANWTESGWFRTGDQGFLDEEGYLTLTGRIKELINRGGEKISPLEIDNILLEHPKVSEAICFGVPDPKYGEIVYAAIVAKSPVSSEELTQFCKHKLADFKVPQKFFFSDSLPRTATGKIQRRNVAAFFLNKEKS
eukprot:TRINITY_DN3259_c0_g1_i1.p1 TRINITY_DN3259_c0_g1~~TRINITY_DN3259_c0_g1_i1.p1  ORF type:complete len:519 (-),score=97.51 TRINITY_DN3259_c0_g1_i1:31-1587(-)